MSRPDARRLAVDTGGTFTDLVVEFEDGRLATYKASTTPHDPIEGVLNVLDAAAKDLGVTCASMLATVELFVHGTTRAINAILTGATARTALLTTEGHRDVLVFREGGRTGMFNLGRQYPDPYIPRAHTYEITERVGAAGEVVVALDEGQLEAVVQELKTVEIEAIAVCLLWSIANPVHELRVGELLNDLLPEVPVTLSHQLNPRMREYQRASSAAIDASLKPVMATYIGSLEGKLRAAGFDGRLLVVTSSGGMVDAGRVADAPIHSINSGPAMAPVAGQWYVQQDADASTAIVADTGGTTYDVSLIREGQIPRTRETWIGPEYFGHLTGFPSIDIRSIGAGGGSIASVDDGGLLHVGPESAGSVPGPVCYGRGGSRPTVTDACVALGYLDPELFLAGSMSLDLEAAVVAINDQLAEPLGLETHEAAWAVLELTTERMVGAIEEITINQGVDPRHAVLIGGGGAAGLNSVGIARRLECPNVLLPPTGAVLSAAGALLSDLSAEYQRHFPARSDGFDFEGVNAILEELEADCQEFIDRAGRGAARSSIQFAVEARYEEQVWELDVPLRSARIQTEADLESLCEDFHAAHQAVFAVASPGTPIEMITWVARASCSLRERDSEPVAITDAVPSHASRRIYFAESGWVDAQVVRLDESSRGEVVGPAVIESPFTTVVVDPGATAVVRETGAVWITPVPPVERRRDQEMETV